MKKLLVAVAATLAAGVMAGSAVAQEWPANPVRVVVPYPPGGATDFSARIYAQHLTEIFGKTFVVENKAGAGGEIGAQQVAASSPDGHTLLLGAVGSHAINSILPSRKPNYQFPDAFSGVSMATSSALAVVVRSSLPVNNLQELIALAKKQPGVLTYGSAGVGSSQHMIAEKFQLDSGIDLMHVPYKGSSPAVSDLLGGQVDMVFDTLPTLSPHAKSDKVRFLAVTTKERSATLPDVPTIQEQGIKDFDSSTRYAMLAPAGTPRDIIDRLSKAMQDIGQMPAVQNAHAAQGAETYTTTPEETDAALKREVEVYADVVKRADLN